MNSALRSFARKYQLTKREQEILSLLSENIIQTKDIASRLKTSFHTVHHQLLSIFSKTQVQGKAQLLSLVLKFCDDEMEKRIKFVPRPIVFYVDDEPDVCDVVFEYLTSAGMRVYLFEQVDFVLESLDAIHPDVVVMESKMPGITGNELLQQIRKRYPVHPGLIVVSAGMMELGDENYLRQNTIGMFDKPFDLELLKRAIADYFKARTYSRNRYIRISAQIEVRVMLENVAVWRTKNIGYGGVCLTPVGADHTSAQYFNSLQVNKTINLSFRLGKNGEQIDAQGSVIWLRPPSPDIPEPSVGVQFTKLQSRGRDEILRFVMSMNAQRSDD